jgi:DNA ligase (NAD+)
VEKFPDDSIIVVQPKLDGHSISHKYIDWKHALSVTRWDWKEGNDVTINASMVRWVNKTIPELVKWKSVEIRWEIIIKNSDFKEISGQFANSRNGISIAHVKDPQEVANRKISFIGYNVFIDWANIFDETEKFELLKKLWFEVPYYETHKVSDLKNPEYVKTMVESFEKYRSDDNELNYAIDWLVLKTNSYKEQLELWENDHDPNWAVAWKYLSEEKTTKLNWIEWTVSRNWYLIPVWLLDTVELSGTKVSRVTLNNYSYVKNWDIQIWDELAIRKSWEIIPFLVKNLSAVDRSKQNEVAFVEPNVWNTPSISTNIWWIPVSCPECGASLWEEWVHIKCSNPQCSWKAKKMIAFFAATLWVDSLWEGIVNALYNAWKLKEPADIFELKETDMEWLEWFWKKLAKKVVGNVEKAKKWISAEVLVKSLWIPGLWERVAVKLLKKYGSLKNLIETYNIADVMSMDGFWENNTRTYFEWLEKEKDLLKSLAVELWLWEVEKQGALSMKLHGKSFCITGTLSKWRTELEQIIESNSGSNKKDVNKNTDFLLLWENGWSKKDKAEKLISEWHPVRIITEADFFEMLKD